MNVAGRGQKPRLLPGVVCATIANSAEMAPTIPTGQKSRLLPGVVCATIANSAEMAAGHFSQ
jgi:hypothetical protein